MKTRRRRRRRVTAKFITILVLFIIALTLGILLLKNAGNDTGENVTPGASTKPSIIDSIFGTPEPDVTPTETVPAETPEPNPRHCLILTRQAYRGRGQAISAWKRLLRSTAR